MNETPAAEATALDVVAAYISAMQQADPDAMQALRAPAYVLDFVHRDAFEEGVLSEEDARRFWPAWFAGFSVFDFEITRTIAAEDVVVIQWTFTGLHDGELGPPVFETPHSASGRTVRFRGVSVYDVADGLIQRETIYLDQATMLVELGAQP